MDKSKLYKVTRMVYETLEKYPDTRSDDRLLIYIIYRDYCGVSANDKFANVIINKDLPSFESIRRARQKIQESNENLRGDKEAEKARLSEQETYINFSNLNLEDIIEGARKDD